MACSFICSSGSAKLIVKSFSTDLRSNSGSVQLREYASPHSRNVQQQVLRMQVQSRNTKDYLSIVSLLRKSQLSSLKEEGKSYILWPERDIAYQVYVTQIPKTHKLADVAPLMNLTFGIITGLINTSTGEITGDKGSDYILEEWLKPAYLSWNAYILQSAPTGLFSSESNIFSAPSPSTRGGL